MTNCIITSMKQFPKEKGKFSTATQMFENDNFFSATTCSAVFYSVDIIFLTQFPDTKHLVRKKQHDQININKLEKKEMN